MHPEDRLDIAGGLGHVVGVAQVADRQLDVITQLGIESVRVTQQQARTHAGLAQHPHDVRPDMPGRGGDSNRQGRLLSRKNLALPTDKTIRGWP